MVMQNTQEIKQRIVVFLRNRGPSLPVHVAHAINQNLLFTGAFLSELLAEKRIKMSAMKIGGSALYLLSGQEIMLENFSRFLKDREKEAFQLLHQNKVLMHEPQHPAVRVALQSLKDFAVPLEYNGKRYWRYFTYPEAEAIEKIKLQQLQKKDFEASYAPQQNLNLQDAQLPAYKLQQQIISEMPLKPKKNQSEEQLPDLKEKLNEMLKTALDKFKQEQIAAIRKETEKSKGEQQRMQQASKVIIERTPFAKKIIAFLQKNNIELLEEDFAKKKEYQAIISISTALGRIALLLIAKEKKKVSENDLVIALQQAQRQKMPLLFVSTGSLDKKALQYVEEYKNLIKYKQI
jgi:hypothetical protein